MKLSEIIFNFNNNAYSSPWEINAINNLRLKKILALIGSGKRVLDVGCYDGTIALQIQRQGNEVVGIDISAKAVKLANKQGLTAYVSNLEEEKMPKAIGKFDVIVAGELIEHIFDPDAFLSKLNTVLQPNGCIILTTPNLAGLGSRLSLLLGKLPWMIENDILPGKSGHIRYFTYDELVKLLNRQGFKVVAFTTDSIGMQNITVPFIDKFFPRIGRILTSKAQKL